MSLEKTPCIEVNGLSYQINENLILDNVTFHLNTGDYAGIVGPNGGGKTTLVKLILGLIPPTKGQIKIFGHSVNSSEANKEIGYVPQKIGQFLNNFPTTVEEVVKSGRTVRRGWLRRFNAKDLEAVNYAMEATGVSQYAKKLLNELSGGERQRVFIARALAAEPKILILDEPTSGVDIGHQERFYEFLRDLRKKFNLTIIYVSHDIDFIAKEVSTVLCLNQKLVCHQTPQAFLTKENLEKIYGPHSKIILHDH